MRSNHAHQLFFIFQLENILRSGDVCPVHVQTVSTSLMSKLVNFTRLIFRRFLSPIIQEILFLIVWFAMDVV